MAERNGSAATGDEGGAGWGGPTVTLPKNALTTNPPARVLRRAYRSHLRPPVRAARIARRQHWPVDASNRPDFLIVGAQKAGTTGLFEGLVRLPGVGVPLVKEVHYFDRPHRPDPSWYLAHFWGSSDLLWGEASPEYFDTPGVAALVDELLPTVRVIVSLRDPVARAVSHYQHSVDFGLERRSLERALTEELELLETGGWTSPLHKSRHGYVSRSRYADSLVDWLGVVGPDRLLVVQAEERDDAYSAAASFLGLDQPAVLRSRAANERRYDPPSPAVTEMLRNALVDDARRLPGILGWDALPSSWTVEG